MYAKLDANTAKTYATVGLVFYGLSTFFWLLGIGFASWILSWANITWIGPWDSSWDTTWDRWNSRPVVPGFLLVLLGLGFLISVALTIWAYFTYKKVSEGNYADARTASLVLGIFGLLPVVGSFIGGIFFLLAYAKLGDVLRGPRAPVYSPTAAPVADRFCVQCGRVVSPESHFCAYCGSELPK